MEAFTMLGTFCVPNQELSSTLSSLNSRILSNIHPTRPLRPDQKDSPVTRLDLPSQLCPTYTSLVAVAFTGVPLPSGTCSF